jgi:hypothetical protein
LTARLWIQSSRFSRATIILPMSREQHQRQTRALA